MSRPARSGVPKVAIQPGVMPLNTASGAFPGIGRSVNPKPSGPTPAASLPRNAEPETSMRRLHIAPSGAVIETAARSTPGTARTRWWMRSYAARRAAGARSARRASITASSTRPRSKPSGTCVSPLNDRRNRPAPIEKHEREDDLRQDEAARHRCVARCTRGPSAILHRVDGRAAGRAPRRRHAEDERRDEAGGRGEREHARIQRQLQRHGVRGELRDEEPAAPMSHGHAGRGAHGRRAAGFRSAAGAPDVRATPPARGARSIRGCARSRGRAADWRCWRRQSAAPIPTTAIRTSSGRE